MRVGQGAAVPLLTGSGLHMRLTYLAMRVRVRLVSPADSLSLPWRHLLIWSLETLSMVARSFRWFPFTLAHSATDFVNSAWLGASPCAGKGWLIRGSFEETAGKGSSSTLRPRFAPDECFLPAGTQRKSCACACVMVMWLSLTGYYTGAVNH